MAPYRDLRKLRDEAQLFASFLQSESATSPELLIDRYLDFKLTSAQAMRGLTDEQFRAESWALDEVVERLESELRAELAEVIPLEVVVLKRFGHTHRKLYQYLWEHQGMPVSATRLRVLTGDQVHTERRVRELRDIGLSIQAGRSSGQNVYELSGDTFDTTVAVSRFAPDFVEAVEAWSPAQRLGVLERLGLT